MLTESTRSSLAAHATAFASARPFRYAVIDDFLEPAHAQSLLEGFPRFDERYALNEMGEVGGKAVRTAVRDLSAGYRGIDEYIQSRDFLDYVSRLTGIPNLLYDPDYEGGGTHENRDGQGLAPHIDFNYHPRTDWHRRLNLIVYLNPEWQRDWGGALRLESDPWRSEQNQVTEVLPLFNRCVVFETNEISWHGFAAIRLPEALRSLSRKSFAIYLYTQERPADETAAPHATVYVPEGMPSDLSEGTVLDAERVLELRGRFAQLRGQLRYLYEREKQFTEQIAKVEAALRQALSAQRPGVEGYLQISRCAGWWADGWCAQRFELDVALSRPARALELEVWVPEQIGGTQHLDIQLGGQSQRSEVRSGRVVALQLPIKLGVGVVNTLRIDSELAWQPSAESGSGDERRLAWKLVSARLAH